MQSPGRVALVDYFSVTSNNVMGPGECGKDSGVGDVVGGVGEARIEATQKGDDELRDLDRMADVAKSGGLGLQPLAVRRDGAVTLHHGVKFVEEEDDAWSRLARKIPSMATHRSRAVGSAPSMARSRMEIQPRTQHSVASH